MEKFRYGKLSILGKIGPREWYQGSYKTAVKRFRLAATQGFANAQYNLGVMMYEGGQGVPQNYVRAYMWTNIFARSGTKHILKKRDVLASKMTPTQIEGAQDLARDCVRKE
jgi:TPR repeat protein